MSLIAIVIAAAVAASTRRAGPGVAAGVVAWLLTSVYLIMPDGDPALFLADPFADPAFVLIQVVILAVTIGAAVLGARLRQPRAAGS